VSVPTIETERLRLRPMVVADYQPYLAVIGSARARFMGGPYSGWAAWGMFCHEIALWELYGHGGLSIERKVDAAWLGVIEINDGPLFPEKELGWMLAADAEGHGYATEAGRALRDWAFGTLGLKTLVSYFHPENSRSMAVAMRLGGVLDDAAPRQDAEDIVFRYG
jgi:RimJ/RimL family protein N-acetyltransferase